MGAHQILLGRVETALCPYDLSFPTLSYCGCPLTRCGPKLHEALGICEHPIELKEPPQQMISTAAGTRSRWFPLPHKRISVGAEALTILLWAASLVSRRGAVDR